MVRYGSSSVAYFSSEGYRAEGELKLELPAAVIPELSVCVVGEESRGMIWSAK
jgi:hypothetical protein